MNKSTQKLVGLVLIVVAIGLVVWGYQQSDSLSSQFNELVKGSPSDRVMMFYIGAAVSGIAGLFLLFKK